MPSPSDAVVLKAKQLASHFKLTDIDTAFSKHEPELIVTLLQAILEAIGVQNVASQLERLSTKVSQLTLLLDLLSFEVLRTDLSHISPARVLVMDPESVENLLDIMYELGLAVGMDPLPPPPNVSSPTPPDTPSISTVQLAPLIKSGSGQMAALVDDIPDTQPTQIDPFPVIDKYKAVRFTSTGSTKTTAPKLRSKFTNSPVKIKKTRIVVSPSKDKKPSIFDDSKAMEKEVSNAVYGISQLVSGILPVTSLPRGVQQSILKKQLISRRNLLSEALRERKVRKAQEHNEKQDLIPQYFTRQVEHEIKMEEKKAFESEKRSATASVHNRRIQVVRLQKFNEEAERNIKAIEFRRRAEEEKIMKRMLEEASRLELETLRESQKLKREKEQEKLAMNKLKDMAQRQQVHDQMELIREEMAKMQVEENIRRKAEKEEAIKLKREEKLALKQDVRRLRDRVKTDAQDFYYRHLDASNTMRKL